MKKYSFLFFLALTACTIAPAKIDYGNDACKFCSMTIVDKQHAAQLVTNKGKAFKYDAIECMLNDLKSTPTAAIELFLVIDYLNPSVLIDATTATYLISPEIKSPMGANLSAFASNEAAQPFVKTPASRVYSWTEIQGQSFN